VYTPRRRIAATTHNHSTIIIIHSSDAMHIQSDRSIAYLAEQKTYENHPYFGAMHGTVPCTTRLPVLMLREIDDYIAAHPAATQSAVIRTAIALYLESYHFPDQVAIIVAPAQAEPTHIAAIAA
jgi:hypothetical protein